MQEMLDAFMGGFMLNPTHKMTKKIYIFKPWPTVLTSLLLGQNVKASVRY